MLPVSDDAPLLQDLMPWSVRPMRVGRGWPMAPEPACLRARWALFTAETDPGARASLLHPTRARGLHTPVTQLPGHRTPTRALAVEDGPCPEPVRIQHGPYDQQWLIPDHRLIDAARPELWRVADGRQVFAIEQPPLPGAAEAPLAFSSLLPDGRSPAGRATLIRPLYRRPAGRDPNLAPGLTDWLADRVGADVTPDALLAWVAAAARPDSRGCAVPLPRSAELWREGVELGRRSLWLHTRGTRCVDPLAERPSGPIRPPGGSRPYVRAALPEAPEADGLGYDARERVLRIGSGLLSPVPEAAWELTAGGVRVLEAWYARRTAVGAPGSLEARRPPAWTRATTSELLELIGVLTLLAELRGEVRDFAGRLAAADGAGAVGAAALRRAGVLPVPVGRRRPALVLEHREEGPDGQFALL
ncbi:type ISP restriction/modification enzyme [Actinacidiphila yeochonensis]|uniref:type ISP restriction/modification enzyme n=1 Tax=Actinacidiphila yeochonensis TaxID=89050 RepID=UPI00056C85BF|nr:type ISP restriction/modification enzyme [Actinacidiphila yeochonensis]